jgi:hypothetical protein
MEEEWGFRNPAGLPLWKKTEGFGHRALEYLAPARSLSTKSPLAQA